jgi:hypothetical protein
LKRAVLLVSITIPVLLWMDHRGSFDELEARALDVTSIMGLGSRNTDVVIVDIDDDDYRDMFHRNTLDPTILTKLVSAIARAQPKVIMVDIVTDPGVWSQIPAHQGVPIIWAYRPDKPEGTSPLPVEGSWGSWAVPRFPTGGPVVRQYARLVPCERQSCRSLPSCKDDYCSSLAWETMKERDPGTALEPSSEELTIRFVRDQTSIRASEVLGLADSPIWSQEGSILGHKTVILGGTYADQHETPLGRKSGVWIWANILETEIEGGGYRTPQWFVLLILGFVESVLLIWLLQVWDFKRGLLVSTLTLPFLSVAFSFIVYHNARRWAYFAMILFTLILGQCIEMLREQQYEQVKEFIGVFRKGPH